MRSRKGWYINPNRKLEVWEKDHKRFDVYLSPELEWGMMFRHGDKSDYLGDVRTVDLLKKGYRKV